MLRREHGEHLFEEGSVLLEDRDPGEVEPIIACERRLEGCRDHLVGFESVWFEPGGGHNQIPLLERRLGENDAKEFEAALLARHRALDSRQLLQERWFHNTF